MEENKSLVYESEFGFHRNVYAHMLKFAETTANIRASNCLKIPECCKFGSLNLN